MAATTEAECLLRSGALYGNRVLLRGGDAGPVFAGFKAGAFSLYFGDAPIVHFDREGRWQRAFFDGLHLLKGLDTSVQAIDRVREGSNLVLKRRTLSYAEASDVDARIRATALDLLAALHSDALAREEPPPPGAPLSAEVLRETLEQVGRWDAAAWFAHREAFLDTYGPIPFLPPDALQSVVLQATLGQSGGVAFGGGPAGEPYVRTPTEFEAHAGAVASLLGRRVEQCKHVFLAGPDVLLRPVADVNAYLEALTRAFPVDITGGERRPGSESKAPPGLNGIHAFLDRFEGQLPEARDWAGWRGRGLSRVTFGVESGDPDVRSAYGKDWDNGSLRLAVERAGGAGLGVGVVTLLGAGGLERATRHVAETTDLLLGLPLARGDLVSLVGADEFRHPGRSAEGAEAFGTARSRWETEAQLDEFKRRLTPLRTERGVKVVPYSPEKQGVS